MGHFTLTKNSKRLTLAMITAQARTTPPVRLNILPYTSWATAVSRANFLSRISRLAMALVAMRARCLASLVRSVVALLPSAKGKRHPGTTIG